MDAPLRPPQAGLVDSGCIQRPELESFDTRLFQAALPKQCHAQASEPISGFLQPVPQRGGSEFGELRLPRPHDSLLQRMAAPQMQQQNLQQVLGGFVLPQTLQGAGRHGQFPPIRWQERFEDSPIFRQARMGVRLFHRLILEDPRIATERSRPIPRAGTGVRTPLAMRGLQIDAC